MPLSRKHLDPRNAELPERKLSYLELAERLDPRLTPILSDELAAGNHIWEATKDFPSRGSLCVSLSRPFKKAHTLPNGVIYTEEDDPHFNVASYATKGPISHVLCAPCRKRGGSASCRPQET